MIPYIDIKRMRSESDMTVISLCFLNFHKYIFGTKKPLEDNPIQPKPICRLAVRAFSKKFQICIEIRNNKCYTV